MPALLWIAAFLVVFLGLGLVTDGVRMTDGWLALGLGFLLLAAVIGAYRLRGEGPLLAILQRGLVILLPILVVAGIMLIAVLGADQLDVRLKQAFLAGLIVVLGWLTTFVLQEERLAKERRMQEIDLLLALRSEILNYAYKLRGEEELGGRELADRIGALTEMRDRAGPRAVTGPAAPEETDPFVFTQADPVVMTAVAGHLPLMDDIAVGRIVQFYAQLEDIAQLARDLNTERFRGLETARRADILTRYVEMHRVAVKLALRAVRRIEEVVPRDRWLAVDGDATTAEPANLPTERASSD